MISRLIVVVVTFHIQVGIGRHLDVDVLFFKVIFGLEVLHFKCKPDLFEFGMIHPFNTKLMIPTNVAPIK